MEKQEIKRWILENQMVLGVDPGWIFAIIQQESAWKTNAVRHEPLYSYLYKTSEFSKLNFITQDTEIMLQKTSWGLGQIMGGLARELGLSLNILNLLEPELNIHFICLNIHRIQKSNLVKCKEDVFSSYNGGLGALSKNFGRYKNQEYVNSVLTHLQNLN